MAANQGKALMLVERMFAFCLLLYSSTAFIRLLLGPEEYGAVGEDILASPIKRVVWAGAYGFSAYFLAKLGGVCLKTLRKMPLLVVLVLYIAASILWSEGRGVSVVSVGALIGNTLIGLYFGIRYDLGGFLRLLGRVYAVIVVFSLLAGILDPSGAMVDGFWSGYFTQRNALAMNAAVGFLVFVMLALREANGGWLWGGLAALSVTLVFLSGSATNILVLFVLACGYAWWVFLRRHIHSARSRALLSVAAVFCFASFFVWEWDWFLSLLGKSQDLTGRTEIWGASLLLGRDKLVFGYGYGAFWVFGGPAQAIWDVFGDPARSSYAHNGYLQVLLDTGIVGLGLLLALITSTFHKAWAYAARTADVWPICFFAFMAIHNLAEGTYAERNSIFWLLFVAILVQLTRSSAAPVRGTIQAARVAPPSARISSVEA